MLPDSQCFTRLKPSPIHGVGVFAIRDIPKDTNIFKDDVSEMEWIDAAVVDRTAGEVKRLYEDFCVQHNGRYGCPRGFNNLTVAWYINEPLTGQEPNVVCSGDYDFFAARDIRAGEELTVDYSTYSDNQE
jgi:SET domain-containing protein